MIVPKPNIEMTNTPIGLNFIPNKADIKKIIFGKKAIEIKKIPIKTHKNEYIGSRLFFLTNNIIIKITVMPIKNAIILECKESICLFVKFDVYR